MKQLIFNILTGVLSNKISNLFKICRQPAPVTINNNYNIYIINYGTIPNEHIDRAD